MPTVEVFADVVCPFTHVGLRRFVAARERHGRRDLTLRVRSWPLEIVNGTPLDAAFIAEEIDEIKAQVAPDLFAGFTVAAFPATSLPALALSAAAYDVSDAVGERVSLALRDLLFERGVDVADRDVLERLARSHGVTVDLDDDRRVRADHAEGVSRGVIGSPHFFTSAGAFFCPAFDVRRDADGRLRVTPNAARFDEFVAGCFG